jgi:hypothetical protein
MTATLIDRRLYVCGDLVEVDVTAIQPGFSTGEDEIRTVVGLDRARSRAPA